MNENGGQKLLQNVIKNERKRKITAKSTLKNNAKPGPKILQEVKMNENCTPMQNVVQK